MSTAAGTVRAAGRSGLALDPIVIGVTSALLLVGLIMVTSASVTRAAGTGNPFYFLEQQICFAFVGIALAALVLQVPTDAWQRMSPALLILSLLLLMMVLIPGVGHTVNGSRRWLRVAGLTFQPSEAARVLLLIYLCSYIVRRQDEVRQSVMGFLKPLGVLGFAALLLLLEPDFGSGVVLVTTGIGVLFLAGVKLRHFFVLCIVGGAGVGLVAVSSAYRVRRLTGFLNPWADPYNTGFQLTQSLIAIGRGEWFGVGLGASIQKLFYLPEAHTDFVFAVLAEELGFAGIALVVLLVLALVYRSLVIARNAAEAGLRFQSYLAAAFGIWFGLQAFINMGVNMGLLPTKGLTLPLLSYGRSSLLVTLGWIGILLRVHHETVNTRSVALRSAAR